MGFTGSYSTGITSKAFSRDKLIVRFQHRVSTFKNPTVAENGGCFVLPVRKTANVLVILHAKVLAGKNE